MASGASSDDGWAMSSGFVPPFISGGRIPPFFTNGGRPPFSIPTATVTSTVTAPQAASSSGSSPSNSSSPSPSPSPDSSTPSTSSSVPSSSSSTSETTSSQPSSSAAAAPTPPPGSFFSTRTVLGPLPTTFTPAASCATPSFGDWNAAAQTPGGYNYGFGYQCSLQSDPGCFPSGFAYDQVPVTSKPYQMYTSATACPVSWAPACSASRVDDFNAVGDAFLTNWLMVGDQVQVCCPSGWACGSTSQSGQVFQHCYTSYTQPSGAITGFTCAGLGSTPAPVTSTYNSAAPSATFGFAPGIALLTLSPSQTDSSVPSPSPSQGSSGLSSGAKAGIGVGVALGIVLLVALAGLAWYVRKNRRRERTKNRAELDGGVEAGTSRSTDNEIKAVSPATFEAPNSAVLEMATTERPVELEGSSQFDEKYVYQQRERALETVAEERREG